MFNLKTSLLEFVTIPTELRLPETVMMQVFEFSPYFIFSVSTNYLLAWLLLLTYSAFSMTLAPSCSSFTISLRKLPYMSRHFMWLGFISWSYSKRSAVCSTVLVILEPSWRSFWISGCSSRSLFQNSRWKLTDFSIAARKMTNLF